ERRGLARGGGPSDGWWRGTRGSRPAGEPCFAGPPKWFRGRAMAEPTPAELIDTRLAGLADWRGETLARRRRLIHEADPEVVETVKWRKPTNPSGVPVWEHAGILCTGEVYKAYVKLTFARGAALPDPAGLFNAGFGGQT